ncbi:hypothetical protein T484DRAFT_1766333 [Baffinella frigidus]|nr:hypothetical protein T484DRAFT_1766333 [Cryptophyta sp. CCMP2293]
MIAFFVNGESRGPAYHNIVAGTYYPTASLYMAGCVTYNFGPDFKYPPPPSALIHPGDPSAALQPRKPKP